MNEFVTTDDVAHDCKYQVHTHTVICKSIMSESGSVCDIVCLHLDDCCEENEVVSSRNSQYTHMKKNRLFRSLGGLAPLANYFLIAPE